MNNGVYFHSYGCNKRKNNITSEKEQDEKTLLQFYRLMLFNRSSLNITLDSLILEAEKAAERNDTKLVQAIYAKMYEELAHVTSNLDLFLNAVDLINKRNNDDTLE